MMKTANHGCSPPLPWLLLVARPRPASAELPENYLERWDDPAVQKRIDDGIEKNRKNDVTLALLDRLPAIRSAAPPSRSRRRSHEFLFGCNIFVLGQMKEKNQAYEDAFLKLFNFATAAFYWDDLEPEPGHAAFRRGESLHLAPTAAGPRGRIRQETRADAQRDTRCCGTTAPTIRRGCPRIRNELRQRYLQRFREIAERYARDIPHLGRRKRIARLLGRLSLCSPTRTVPASPMCPGPSPSSRKLFRPENLLMINDVTSFNWPANETNRFYRQCRKLLDDGVEIEGIGFQFHFFNRNVARRTT